MIVAIGCDHRGYEHKVAIIEALAAAGFPSLDMGCGNQEVADYPDQAFAVAEAVGSGEATRGILICGSGIGVSIAANKVKNIRAALCWTLRMAETTRRHNDSNIICFNADNTEIAATIEMTLRWLATDFEGGRHARRVDKIIAYENARN